MLAEGNVEIVAILGGGLALLILRTVFDFMQNKNGGQPVHLSDKDHDLLEKIVILEGENHQLLLGIKSSVDGQRADLQSVWREILKLKQSEAQ